MENKLIQEIRKNKRCINNNKIIKKRKKKKTKDINLNFLRYFGFRALTASDGRKFSFIRDLRTSALEGKIHWKARVGGGPLSGPSGPQAAHQGYNTSAQHRTQSLSKEKKLRGYVLVLDGKVNLMIKHKF